MVCDGVGDIYVLNRLLIFVLKWSLIFYDGIWLIGKDYDYVNCWARDLLAIYIFL